VLGAILLFLPALQGAPAAVEITIDLKPGNSFDVLFAGPAAVSGTGDFRGSLAINDSAAEMPLAGRAEAAAGRARLVTTLRYADVPAQWMSRSRPGVFDFRLRGEIPGAGTIAWSGTLPWKTVAVTGAAGALTNFVQIGSFELTALSERRTEGRCVLTALNPFGFSVSVEGPSYRVGVNGQDIGGGSARGRVLRAKKKAGIELPFSTDRARFLAAAGERWAVGAAVDAELAGTLTVHLASAAFEVPFRYPGRLSTDGARSGVFSHPDGAGSLSLDR